MNVSSGESKVSCNKEQYCIGTWNIALMNRGKLDSFKQKMARVNIDILGINELKWTGMGEFNSDNHYIYYCGQESLKRNRAGLVFNKRAQNAALGCSLINGRMIYLCFQGQSFNITLILVYAPNTTAKDAEVDRFFEDWKAVLELTLNEKKRKGKDVLFIIKDWNAKGGSQEISRIICKFGLVVQNEAGPRLTEFCQENMLVIENTHLKQHKTRLYPWTSAGGQYENQVDNILCSRRGRSST